MRIEDGVTFRDDFPELINVEFIDNGYHSFRSWGMIMTSAPAISQPEPIINLVEIYGRDQPLDLTQALDGDVHYQARTVTMEFVCMDGKYSDSNRDHMINFLHGQRKVFCFDNDPNWSYVGRLSCGEVTYKKHAWYITITATCDPFKYFNYSTVDVLPEGVRYDDGIERYYKDIPINTTVQGINEYVSKYSIDVPRRVWMSDGRHAKIPIKHLDRIRIYAGMEYDCHYAFLKTNATVLNLPAGFCKGHTLEKVDAGEASEMLVAPSDAKYLYIQTERNDTSYMPMSVVINGETMVEETYNTGSGEVEVWCERSLIPEIMVEAEDDVTFNVECNGVTQVVRSGEPTWGGRDIAIYNADFRLKRGEWNYIAINGNYGASGKISIKYRERKI